MAAKPSNERLAHQLANAQRHHSGGRLDEAQRLYLKVLRRDPHNIAALQLLGVIGGQKGRFAEAADWFRKAISYAPRNAELHYNFAQASRNLGDPEGAYGAFSRAIALGADFVEAREGRAAAAREASYKTGIANGTPHHWRQLAAAEFYELGLAYMRARMGAKAESAFQEAVRLDPENAMMVCHYGDLLVQIGRLTEAEPLYRKATTLDPTLVHAHNNLASLLKEFGQIEEADALFRRALELNPSLPEATYALSNYKLMVLNYRPDVSPEEASRAHRDWGTALIANISEPPIPITNDPAPNRVLRVGYVSPDFRQHSITYFLEPLLSHHDRAVIETFGYANVADPDPITERLRSRFQNWRAITEMSDVELREQVHRDRIDILVDLAGHTSRTRITSFAVRSAPVTATWLGYPATTGLPTIDYRFTDEIADPSGLTDKLHTERLVRLPQGFLCYRPPVDAPMPNPTPVLKSGVVTFGSFNNLTKVTPDVIETWARILNAVPNARLLLKGWIFADCVLRQRMTDRFAKFGVAAERIHLRPLIPGIAAHLGLYHEIDIGLDPFPYNGTTTTCEALWMGVPVVTLAGRHHAARVGLSLLTRVDLAHLAVSDVKTYVGTAVELARDITALNELRIGLRERMRASPLMDATRFARDVEAAYRAMWRAWCARQTASDASVYST